jgi:predicted nucleotidyltransferase component of viral defense system
MNKAYFDTARLMLQIAPMIFAGHPFALKGGTAINLFWRDMPRLSVDLDLLFPDHTLTREDALKSISTALHESAEQLQKRGFHARTVTAQDTSETKLLVQRNGVEVKVEVNFVLRGTVFPVRTLPLSQTAQQQLMAEIDLPVASFEDVYGGKLVAALDRQHPRDLFDVMLLMQNEGITAKIRRAFVVYLASHNRPIHELLTPVCRDLRMDFEHSFVGMTTDPVTLEALLKTREQLISTIQSELDNAERKFLLSLIQGEPEWNLLEIPHLAELPALRWKLRNIEKLKENNAQKFKMQIEKLERLLR